MKKIFYFMVALATFTASAQVGIGVPTANIDASAQLEVASTTKGFLAPRMTETQKNAITSPAAGLLVYQTDGTSGFYYYDGTTWKQGLGPQGATGAAGAAGVAGQTNTSLLYPSASIYADGAAPTNAPSAVTTTYGNFGWYFKKTGNSKINWYIQPKSSSMKVSDLTGLYLELFNVAITNASDMPYITVYTKATGSGDAASWYKSRRSYTFSGTPATNTKYLGFANLGATSPNSYNNNLLDLVADNILSRGDYASTEDILFIVINSSSVASTCEFVANKLGVITGSGTQEFLFMPPSSVADLSGYATTNALSTEVARAQAAEATLTSSVSALSNTVSQFGTLNVSNYATTEALDMVKMDLNSSILQNNDEINNLKVKQFVNEDKANSLTESVTILTNDVETLQTSVQDLMAAGTQGPQGIQGIQGLKGDTGDKGDKGIQGEQGPAGTPADLSGYATTSALDAETARAQSAELNLSDAISFNKDKSSLAIADVRSVINQETARAQAAEETLTSSVTALSNTVSQITAPDLSNYATKLELSDGLSDKAPIFEPTFIGTARAFGFKVPNGSSSQYLMADGSVSTSTGGGATVNEAADEFTAETSQSIFTLTQTPAATSRVKMYINGIRISNAAYSVSGTTLMYDPANNGNYSISASDRIQFDYSY